MRVAGKSVVEHAHVFVQHRMPTNGGAKIFQFLRGGKFSLDQQVTDLNKIAIQGQFLNGIASISENPLFAVEKRNGTASGSSVDISFIQRDQASFASEFTDIQPGFVFRTDHDRKFNLFVLVSQFGRFCHLFRSCSYSRHHVPLACSWGSQRFVCWFVGVLDGKQALA